MLFILQIYILYIYNKNLNKEILQINQQYKLQISNTADYIRTIPLQYVYYL